MDDENEIFEGGLCHCLQVAAGSGKTAEDLHPEHAEAAISLVAMATGSLFAGAMHVIGNLIECGQLDRLCAEAEDERAEREAAEQVEEMLTEIFEGHV
jgi:hypothetical protein